MAALRVTQNMLAGRSTATLQGSLSRLAATQETLSTGRRVNRASDSPSEASAAMGLRVSFSDRQRYLRSAQDGIGWLSSVDTTLSSMTNNVNRAYELAIQGANGSTSVVGRGALATEVDQLREGLLAQANTSYLGRPVFGGVTPGSVAFNPDGTYAGSTAGQVTRTIDAGIKVRVDVPGTDVVGVDGNNLFTDLDALSTALRTGDEAGIRAGINAMRSRLSAIGDVQARNGSVQRRTESAIAQNEDALLTLRSSISQVEDADLAKTMVDLKVNEVAHQAALGAAARVLQPSLMDFLR